MPKSETSPSDVENENRQENSTGDLVELRTKLETQIGELISPEQRGQVVDRVIRFVRGEVFRGPLPHPKHLKAYNEAVPDAADRIIKMAEDALNHNIRITERALRDDSNDRRLGLILGFVALLALIAGAVYCVSIHETIAAGVFLGVGACGVVARFIIGRNGSNSGSDSDDDKITKPT